jgi:polyribonucleotide 5'-hydroxyl-kinase
MASSSEATNIDTADLSDPAGERHILQAHEELRVEIAFGTSPKILLQKGSCELWGCELAVGKTYEIANGGLQIALFSWHGCVVDIDGVVEISYTSDETDANIAFVNTHAQLEALRDDGLQNSNQSRQGPRVMIVGPPESGKSSLCKTLVAYACKLGRTPLWVDLDPMDNSISVPGTLSVAPMTAAAITPETFATCGIPPNTVHPLVLWHGSCLQLHPDLYRAQVDRIAQNINKRLEQDELARASGLIVNTNGWIQDEGFQLLLHSAKALQISIIMVLGHDRLYSMISNHYKKSTEAAPPKILKLPRSGGVVSRPAPFLRQVKSRAVKRYFYGDLIDAPKSSADDGGSSGTAMTSSNTMMGGGNTATPNKVPQLTPYLLQLQFSEVQIYKVSSMALSSSLLPVAQQQSTDAIQMIELDISNSSSEAESLQHMLLAVCHPTAVAAYRASGRARDLVTGGTAGFCAVERVIVDTDTLHLLSPCAGALPSQVMLLGDVTWME